MIATDAVHDLMANLERSFDRTACKVSAKTTHKKPRGEILHCCSLSAGHDGDHTCTQCDHAWGHD